MQNRGINLGKDLCEMQIESGSTRKDLAFIENGVDYARSYQRLMLKSYYICMPFKQKIFKIADAVWGSTAYSAELVVYLHAT